MIYILRKFTPLRIQHSLYFMPLGVGLISMIITLCIAMSIARVDFWASLAYGSLLAIAVGCLTGSFTSAIIKSR
jgi:hypothetical protein